MVKTLPVVAAFAALCIGFALPAQSDEDVGDPNMKFFYPDGSIQWEGDREFDRHFDRMEEENKAAKQGRKSGEKSPGNGQSPGDDAAPASRQRSN